MRGWVSLAPKEGELDSGTDSATLLLMNIPGYLTPSVLRIAADLQERILALQSQLDQLLGGDAPTDGAPTSKAAPKAKKRQLSPAGLAAIRAGVRKREARKRAGTSSGSPAAKPKRRMSDAARAALSAAAKARWKKAKAAGLKSL